MHEAGAVQGAMAPVIDEWPAAGGRRALELHIRDATRAEADAVDFYARAILSERGFGDAEVMVTVDDVRCALCGTAATDASPADPQCGACGAPLPRLDGPAIVCREVAPCA